MASPTRADAAFEVVYLARHGETEWNRAGRRQGRLDSPLTDAGRRHAAALARWAAGRSIDLVAASPLGRARTTAEALGLPVVTVEELAEMDHGRMAGMTSAQIDARFPGELERRDQDKYRWRFPEEKALWPGR